MTWYRILSVLMCLTIFVTTYILIIPATTMEADEAAVCGFVSHKHASKCFDGEGNAVCGLPEHEHDMGCFKTPIPVNPYVCGHTYEHTHRDDCYTNGVLTCSAVEHIHSEACLSVEEQLRAVICRRGTEILSGVDVTDSSDYAKATRAINVFYSVLDREYYERASIDENGYTALCRYTAQLVRELEAKKKSARPRLLLGASSPSFNPSDPVDFAATYGGHNENAWQIVSGIEASSTYKVVYSGSTPLLRLKKSVLPAGKEDEFYIALTVEPMYVWNWQRLFSEADLIIDNSHNSFTATGKAFSRSTPLGQVKDYIGFSQNCSYFLPGGQQSTFSNDSSTQPSSKNHRHITSIVVHVSSSESYTFPVDMYFSLSTVSGLSFVYTDGTSSYKSREISFTESSGVLDIPDTTYADMLIHGFDFLEYMDPFSSVSFGGSSSLGTMSDETTAKTVTDYMGDYIELLEIMSYSGNEGADNIDIDEDANRIDWSLEGVDPYLTANTVETAYEEYYISSVDERYFARVNAYQLIYKVKLKNEYAGFVSSVSGSALPTPANTAAAAKYLTNDGGGNHTAIVYQLVEDPDTVYTADFDSPVVRGALYELSLRKLDSETRAPLENATFRLTRTDDSSPIGVTGSNGVYSYEPDGENSTVITNASGMITVTGLPDGTYCLKEIDPPEGYKIDGTDEAVFDLCYTDNASALTASGSVFEITAVPEILNKEKPKYRLELHKESSTGLPLEGVGFTIYSGAEVIDTLVTDENGDAVLTDGVFLYSETEYTLTETTPPDGYYRPTDSLTFMLDETGSVFTSETEDEQSYVSCTYDTAERIASADVVNTPGKELPSTGGSGVGVYLTVGVCMMIFAAAAYETVCALRKKSSGSAGE